MSRKVLLHLVAVLVFSCIYSSTLDLILMCNCDPPVSCRTREFFSAEVNNEVETVFHECRNLGPSNVEELHLNWARKGISFRLDRFINLEVLTISHSIIKTFKTDLYRGLQQLKKLRICGNEIKELEQFGQLTNLEKLFISNNKVEVIRNETFSNLRSLKLLTMENNRISFINSHAFAANKNLEELNLNINDLRYLVETTFNQNINLRVISLNHNEIEYFSPKTLSQNIKLETLRLHGNKLEGLEKNVFNNNINLRWIELGANRLLFIDSKILNNLKNLEFADFSDNYCIDDSFPIEMNIEHVQELIKRNCHFLATL